MIAAVVLAAGASSRLGRPKQVVMLGGETLVERAVRVAREAGLLPVMVVVRAGSDFRLERSGVQVIVNDRASEGMAASIRCGVQAAQTAGVAGVVVMTCDQVAVTSEHLRALCAEPEAAAGSAYAGKIGVPAYFPAARFGELLRLEGDTGARELLRGARALATEELELDIDTEMDVARAVERYG